MVVLFVLVGVLVGLVFKPKAKNHVMKVLPKDHRFIDFTVKHEDAFGLDCESVKGYPPQRFIKLAAGFTGRVGKVLRRTVTRFIGLSGTAYTIKVKGGQAIEISRKEGKGNPSKYVQLTNAVLLGDLATAVKALWGPDVYAQIPDEQRQQLEDSKVNVTVDIDPVMTPEGFPSISEEDLFREEDRKGAETYWQGKKMAEKGSMMKDIFILLAGAGLMAIASKFLGWW